VAVSWSCAAGPAFGARLRELRRERGLTQEQLAEKAGISTDVIAKLEQGKKTGARLATVCQLAGALGVDVAGLLGAAVQPGGAGHRSRQAEENLEFGARIRKLLAAGGMSPRELEAVLSAGMPGVPQAKRATLTEQVTFMATEIRVLRAEVSALTQAIAFALLDDAGKNAGAGSSRS